VGPFVTEEDQDSRIRLHGDRFPEVAAQNHRAVEEEPADATLATSPGVEHLDSQLISPQPGHLDRIAPSAEHVTTVTGPGSPQG